MRTKRAKTPDRTKFNRGRLVILAMIVLLAVAGPLISRFVRDRALSTLLILAVLAVLVLAAGRVIRVVNRAVDDRYRGLRTGNEAWAKAIGASYEATAAPPPAGVTDIVFAEDRRVLVPVSASETVTGRFEARPFMATHLVGYEKLRPGTDAKGRDASSNIVYLVGDVSLPPVRFINRALSVDYGRPMTSVALPDSPFAARWRVESEDPGFAASLLDSRIPEFLAERPAASFSLALSGPYVIAYGDPAGDADAISNQLELLTGLSARIPGAAT